MFLGKNLYQNAKKPEGAGGVFMMNRMNERHRHMAKWGFSHLEVKEDELAIDIGCGGGANIRTLLQKAPKGKVFGMDYAEVSVSLSQKNNKKAVATGRCQVVQADVSQIPFSDESFTLATAFETVYFWPDMSKAIKEVYRILKRGGRFMICNETNGFVEKDEKIKNIIEGMNIYTAEELKDILKEGGFENIAVYKNDDKPWISLIAVK